MAENAAADAVADAAAIVGVVGAGTMGAGIAQVALEHDHEVVLHDVDAESLGRGRARIRGGLSKRAAKLGLDPESVDDWIEGRLNRLRHAETLDALGAEADVVIEAALEDLELKRTIFHTLDRATAPDAVLATNTSALSVATIAQSAGHPERVLGLHFFNPAPVMPLVEVVVPETTDEAMVERATALVAAWGKTPVRCADTPGFIVNRVNRPFTIEALRMLEGGEASIEEIDAAVKDGGFPMGPFELMDLVGIDVNLAAARAVWVGLGVPDRLRPAPIQELLVERGELGRKTGRGFYVYEGGSRTVNPALPAPASGPAQGIAILARIRAAIDAEATRAEADGVASASDIQLALRLGAGHPAR